MTPHFAFPFLSRFGLFCLWGKAPKQDIRYTSDNHRCLFSLFALSVSIWLFVCLCVFVRSFVLRFFLRLPLCLLFSSVLVHFLSLFGHTHTSLVYHHTLLFPFHSLPIIFTLPHLSSAVPCMSLLSHDPFQRPSPFAPSHNHLFPPSTHATPLP